MDKDHYINKAMNILTMHLPIPIPLDTTGSFSHNFDPSACIAHR